MADPTEAGENMDSKARLNDLPDSDVTCMRYEAHRHFKAKRSFCGSGNIFTHLKLCLATAINQSIQQSINKSIK